MMMERRERKREGEEREGEKRERDGNRRVASKMMPCKMGKRDGCRAMIGTEHHGRTVFFFFLNINVIPPPRMMVPLEWLM